MNVDHELASLELVLCENWSRKEDKGESADQQSMNEFHAPHYCKPLSSPSQGKRGSISRHPVSVGYVEQKSNWIW